MTAKAKPHPIETDHAATHADEFAGQGGSYIIKDGKRVLVERTLQAEEAKPEHSAGAGRAAPKE
jgi:hypothetical protein